MAEGVWRTVGGRRIFIAEGDSLQDAMNKSGKFGEKKWDFRGVKEALDKIETAVKEMKDPFSKKAQELYKSLNEQEKILQKLEQDVKSGAEDGDLPSLRRQQYRLRKLKNEFMNMAIRNGAGVNR